MFMLNEFLFLTGDCFKSVLFLYWRKTQLMREKTRLKKGVACTQDWNSVCVKDKARLPHFFITLQRKNHDSEIDATEVLVFPYSYKAYLILKQAQWGKNQNHVHKLLFKGLTQCDRYIFRNFFGLFAQEVSSY
jgi:hypothetical protein